MSLMICLNFGNHFFRNIGNHSWRIIAAIHFLNQISDFSGCDALGIELDNSLLEDISMPFIIWHSVLMKLTVSVSRNFDFYLSELRINLAVISTISRISGIPAIALIRIVA